LSVDGIDPIGLKKAYAFRKLRFAKFNELLIQHLYCNKSVGYFVSSEYQATL